VIDSSARRQKTEAGAADGRNAVATARKKRIEAKKYLVLSSFGSQLLHRSGYWVLLSTNHAFPPLDSARHVRAARSG
jgi:hypothetical protein